MKRIQLAILATAAGFMLAGAFSCGNNNNNGGSNCIKGSGTSASQKRTPGTFTKVNLQGDYNVVLKQDSSYGVTITADTNLFQYIKTTVTNGTLVISNQQSICSTSTININIGVGNLAAVIASGKEVITADSAINAQSFAFQLSGADNVTMTLNATSLTSTISGKGTINLTGKAASHDITVSGTGTLKAYNFVVGAYTTHTSGVGNFQVNAVNTLDVHTSGTSDVKYMGDPKITNQHSGISIVQKAK